MLDGASLWPARLSPKVKHYGPGKAVLLLPWLGPVAYADHLPLGAVPSVDPVGHGPEVVLGRTADGEGGEPLGVHLQALPDLPEPPPGARPAAPAKGLLGDHAHDPPAAELRCGATRVILLGRFPD